MILISRRALILLGAFVTVVTAFLGVYGYRSLATFGATEIFNAQRLLYLTLLLVAVELVLFVRVLLRSRNIERELDKLIPTTRFRGLPNARNLRRLGPIGEQISRIYDQLNALSERKSLKISALSELVEFLMNNLALPAVAATADGTIAYVSRAYVERMKKARGEIIEGRLEELARGVVMEELLAELERSHTAVERKGERSSLNFYPIRNIEGEVAYVVCLFQGHMALVERATRATAAEPGRGGVGRGVRRLVGLGRQTLRRFSREDDRPEAR